MTTFIGDYPCKLDAKGRLTLPSAFKRQLSSEARDTFVVKKDLFEQCLVLYPMDEWERQVKLLRSRISHYNKEHNRFLRGFYKGTAELLLDSNSRLLLPKRLLELINAGRDVILAGQDGKIEIWAKDQYESIEENEDDFAELAQRIMDNAVNEDKE